MKSTQQSERRRYNRLPIECDVDVVTVSGNRAGDQIAGKVVNISKEGIGVLLRAEIPSRTQVALTIYSEEDQSVASGELIWSKEMPEGILHGIRIIQWSYLEPSIENQLPKS
ncbi:MAG: hypothetical protein KCHDKBKB_01002 [Elusimicrobia bacterium]|nr:hypothetical protein [Elusimicrobiota bacterium]